MTYTELKRVKESVRERDGYRCRDCGMTEASCLEQANRVLDVHRIIPGGAYCLENCVALCCWCHRKKPNGIANAVFGEDISEDEADPYPKGVVSFFLTPYNSAHRKLLDAIREESIARSVDPATVVLKALRLGLKRLPPVLDEPRPVHLEFDLSDF
jgi:hypothetical protein